MSTILDALRKLEEERRSRTADVRSRLLLSPAHQTQPLRLQRTSWRTSLRFTSMLSFAVAGAVAGAGVMWWRSYATPPQPMQIAELPSSSANHKTQTPLAPQISPSHASTQPHAKVLEPDSAQVSPSLVQPVTRTERALQPVSSEQEVLTPPLSATALPTPPPSLMEEKGAELTTTSAVQRSPFVPPSPPPRNTAPRPAAALAASANAPPPILDALAFQTNLRRQQKEAAAAQSPPLAPPGFSQHTGGTESTSAPTGTSLSFLQWSSDPERRLAFLRVNGGPLTMAHEGDVIGGYTVVEIRQNGVELQSGETRMTLRTH